MMTACRDQAVALGASEMPLVDVKTYYLEMLAHANREVPPPRNDLSMIQTIRPSVADYRRLYDAVGKQYHWHSRGKLADIELEAIIHHPGNEIHVLYANGEPAGFAELDRRNPQEIELVQFGLLPEFIGQGLGKYFLQWTIDKAWSYGPSRFWLHTCTLDHPAALPNYLKAGFRIYKEVEKQRDI
jgi:GNAT superfamily N-acetyltransferase